MTTRRLILHVGPHKTGSTYIQKRLLRSSGDLEKLGGIYPQVAVQIYGHHDLANHLHANPEAPEMRAFADQIKLASAGYDTVILSSEVFSLKQAEKLKAFAEIFDGFKIEVVYYLRRLSGFLPSHWQELIKAGDVISFEEYMMMACADRPPFKEFSQLAQLEVLRSVFGAESISILSYDNIQEAKGDVYQEFLKLIFQTETEQPQTRETVNASLTYDLVELVRSLNTMFLRLHSKKLDSALGQKAVKFVRDNPDDPDVRLFRDGYEKNKRIISVGASHPLVALSDAKVRNEFGKRILNPYSERQLYSPSPKPSVVQYCSRYWIDATLMSKTLKDILAKLLT